MQKRISSANASSVSRLDPELRRPADAQGGVFRERLVKLDVAVVAHDSLSSFARSPDRRRDCDSCFVDIARAEAEDQVARPRACCPVSQMKPVELAAGNSLPDGRAPRSHPTIVWPLIPGNRRFAGGINVGDHDAIGVVESAAEFLP